MKIILLLPIFILSSQIWAQALQLDLHLIDANVFFPKNSSDIAGSVIADRIILTSDILSLRVDENKPLFEADIAISDRTLFLDTSFATITTDLGGAHALVQPIQKLKTKDTRFIYNQEEIFVATKELELIYDHVDIKAWNTQIGCQNDSSKKSITKENAFVDCLNHSAINALDTDLPAKIDASYDDINLVTEVNSAIFKSDGFQISTNTFNVDSSDYKFSFNNLNAFCSKEAKMKALDPKAYVNGCFKESYLTLSSFEMTSPNVKLSSDIELLNIAGPRLRLSTPEIVVKTNKDQTTIRNVRAACNKNITTIDDINFDNFVEGCLENSLFNVSAISSDSLERKNRAQQEIIDQASTKQLKKAKKENKGFSLEDFSQLELSSRENNVSIIGKVKILFLLPEFEINAKATFEKEISTIHFDVQEALILGFIPVKKILLYFLNKFIPEGNISINENIISLKLK